MVCFVVVVVAVVLVMSTVMTAPNPYPAPIPVPVPAQEVLGVLLECNEDTSDGESAASVAGESSSRTSSSTVVSSIVSSVGSSMDSDSISISTPPSPTKQRPHSFQQTIGIDPSILVGKTLRRARRSTRHPCVTMHFSDGSVYQILVDGYDPQYPGVPKELEMDAFLDRIFEFPQQQQQQNRKDDVPSTTLDLPIVGCRLVDLADKAFERRGPAPEEQIRWDQRHLGLAFKFAGDESMSKERGGGGSGGGGRWHCVYATLAVYDPELQMCVFRNFEDVYLESVMPIDASSYVPGPSVTDSDPAYAHAHAHAAADQSLACLSMTSPPSSPVKAYYFQQAKSPKKHSRRSSKSKKHDGNNRPFNAF